MSSIIRPYSCILIYDKNKNLRTLIERQSSRRTSMNKNEKMDDFLCEKKRCEKRRRHEGETQEVKTWSFPGPEPSILPAQEVKPETVIEIMTKLKLDYIRQKATQ